MTHKSGTDEELMKDVRILKKEIIQIRESLEEINNKLNKLSGRTLIRSSSSQNILNFKNEKFLTKTSKNKIKRSLTDTYVEY